MALRLLVFLFALAGQNLADALSAGDVVALYACNASMERQVFQYVSSPGDLQWHIESLSQPNLVFDIDGPSNATGTRIHVWGSYNPPVFNQQWKFTGSGAIISMYNGLCAAVKGAYPGATLVLATCSDDDPLQNFAYNYSSNTISLVSDADLCLQAGDTTVSCANIPFSSYAYCNESLAIDLRVADLISRMTLQEKAAALDSSSPAIPRLAVPPLPSGEGLHGVVSGCLPPNTTTGNTGCPTSFPCPMALGAAFDPALWLRVGNVIGYEARAIYNAGAGSMWMFAPNINPSRDPRWGRNQEVPSEDPVHVSTYAQNFINGVQNGELPGARYLLAAATAKHLAVYDLEGYMPRTDPLPRPASAVCDTPGGCQRWNFDAFPPMDDYVNFYLAPFHAAVTKARVRSIMCSYNAQYGTPSCGYGKLQQDTVRGEWMWDGHVVSDYTAIELMQDTIWNNCQPPYPPLTCTPDDFPSHNFTHTVPETINTTLSAGTDVDLGPLFNMWLEYLVSNNSIPEALLDIALSHFYRTHFMLGLFDDPKKQSFPWLPPSVVDSPAHRNVALQAARESIVLLKNEGPFLPIQNAHSLKIAFIGPHANSTQALLSNYHGDNHLVNSHSPLQVALARGWSVTYEKGCNICDVVPPGFPNMPCPAGKATNRSGIPAAVAAAQDSDIAVVFVGLDQTSEAENFDRDDVLLPGVQEDLIKQVYAVQPKTVVVFINGGSVSSLWTADNVPAIIEAFYGGELGGEAIIDVLNGTFSPAGKLPVTVYFPNITNRDIRDVDLSSAGGITHLYFDGPVLYPFGWGLSYTTFKYAWLETSSNVVTLHTQDLAALPAATHIAHYTIEVTNTGSVQSDCVVLGFANPTQPTLRQPRQMLFNFTRLFSIAPGASQTVTLALSLERFARVDEAGVAWVHPGVYGVSVGDVVEPARVHLEIVGEPAVLADMAWAKALAQ